jgi:anaerobic selenocysteine-containing dehydrogenase
VNKGVLCGKGSAGIMQHYAPARLRKPLLRVGERGSGEFKEIEWDEALATRHAVARRHPRHRPAQARLLHRPRPEPGADRLVGEQFGTPNYAAHGGFCSVNMAAAGLYTIGGSFWEFGEPDWDHTKLLHAVRRRRGP